MLAGKFGAISTAAIAVALAMPAHANILVNYPNFTGACGSAALTCVGNTATVGPVLRVTPATGGQAGAAYSTTPVTLGSGDTFSTQFQFQFTNPGGIDPADGITFVLAASASGLGTGGGAIGYGGVANSVAIEFDTYNNGGNDGNSSNHVAVDMNGHISDGSSLSDQALANAYGIASCGFGAPTGCMSDGDVWTVTIGYNGTNLNVSVQDAANPVDNVIVNYPIDVSSFLGTTTAFVGFTSGTGAGFENHDILNWQFANTSTITPTPEPTSLALLGVGLAAIGVIGGRRRR